MSGERAVEDAMAAWEVDLLLESVDRVQAALAEYERCCDPAPYTSERALYERMCVAIGRPIRRHQDGAE